MVVVVVMMMMMSSFGLLIFPKDKIANGVLCDGVLRLSKYQYG
jgi:hypothetical protein